MIERLLTDYFPEVEYFLAQVPAITVVGMCACGCGTIEFEVDADRARRAPAPHWKGGDVVAEGDASSWLMLMQADGWLSELEHVAGYGPRPNELDASKIAPESEI